MSGPGAGRTVLLLAGAQYLVRSVERLSAEGFRVVTVDRDPAAPAHAVADAVELGSVADAAFVAQAAKRQNADVIVPGTEAGVVAAAAAAEQLGLAGLGLASALRCTDKIALREAWAAAGLAQPRFRALGDDDGAEAVRAFGLPAVVKPARNGGSKGVSVLLEDGEVDAAVAEAKNNAPDGRWIVEAYVPGPLLTADGFVRESEVLVAMLGDVVTQDQTRYRVNMALNYPAAFAPATLAEARTLIADAVRALGLRRGAFHVECIVGPSGVELVELAARGGGSYLSSTLVELVSGLSGPVTFARLLIGDDVPLTPTRAAGATLRFLQAPDGLLREVRGVAEARALPGIVELGIDLAPNGRGGVVANDNARHGFIVATGPTRDEAVARADAAARLVQFVMDDHQSPVNAS